MNREIRMLAVLGALLSLLPGSSSATTREIAELQQARLTFGQSVLNQLSYDTYRDPFDELQTRPHNLLFSNIGRHSTLTPWQGQEGIYTRYFNALIGNNGTANVDNEADSIQGSWIQRQSDALAWGVSAAFLSGSDGSSDANGTSSFEGSDDLLGFDLRGAAARQLSERRVLGAGVRVIQASNEITDRSFEPGVGGFFSADKFDQLALSFDAGLRTFRSPTSSWEAQLVLGFGTSTQDEFSEDIDDTGAVTDRFVTTKYDIGDLNLGIHAGYNRLKSEGPGETEYRVGLERSQRDLNNSDLSYAEDAGGVAPALTLLGQDAIVSTRLTLSAKSIFQAGATEMFGGAQLAYGTLAGATQVDAAGTIVTEEIDDSQIHLGLTAGLRQPFLNDKLRFIVSGRADLTDQQVQTSFDTASDGDDSSLSTAQYAIGLEGVLSNVTFDVAWLTGEEAPVVPVPLGLPGGSRRSVQLDRLIFSAAVSW